MNQLRLDKETIIVRINGIQGEVGELEKLGKRPLNEFTGGDAFKLAHFHLHRALEGVFHIASHILSRLPGGAGGSTYKELAALLGEHNIVDKQFANDNLRKMAGYRNRLVHFYAEITPEEIYNILHNNLGDFDTFIRAVKEVLEDPSKFGLAI